MQLDHCWSVIWLLSLVTPATLAFSTTIQSQPVRSQPVSVSLSNENPFRSPQNQKIRNNHPNCRWTNPSSSKATGTALFSFATAIDVLFQTCPYVAAALTCGIKASSADFVAQLRHQQHKDDNQSNNNIIGTEESHPSVVGVDWKRNLSFLLYGAIYQGIAQEFIYNRLYQQWFGAGTSIPVVLTKVAFDLLIQTSLVTLPLAYLTKALVGGNYSLGEALRRYRADVVHHGLLKKYYMLWGPVQCVTFGIVPEHYRVSFMACVSFFWLIVLSSISSSAPKMSQPTGQPQNAVVEATAVNAYPAFFRAPFLTLGGLRWYRQRIPAPQL